MFLAVLSRLLVEQSYLFTEDDLAIIQERVNKAARLWGIGMMLGFYAKYGNEEKAKKCLDILNVNYNFPDLLILPTEFSKDISFYARYAAHVLYGLAYLYFY